MYVRLAMCLTSRTIRRVWHPGLCRVCREGNSSAEKHNRTTDPEKNLVRTTDVHPFLRCAVVDRQPCVFAFRAASWIRVDGDVGGAFTLPNHLRLRIFWSDSRALQDSFFMSSTIRQVPRVL